MPSDTARVRLTITGVVQGVGFRPAVARIAAQNRLAGFVLNDARAVRCELEGPGPRVDAAVRTLRDAPPPLACVDSFATEMRPALGETFFRILDSTPSGDDGERTLVAPDIATCADCLRELFDPADRRHRHPLITCTNCGPRYTVITDLPYDRPTTTMAGFAMCPSCAAEYGDPADRRYHAQTIACPECGPTLSWHGPGRHRGAVESAAAALRAGLIVAVKGVGGYHLACRADDDDAVARLRRRKNRPAKPFAVMAVDVEAARWICHVDDVAARSLTSAAAPIVLLPARAGAVSIHVAPNLTDLGVMLAYSPVHHLLFAEPDMPALVMTSANQGGSPIVSRDGDLDWIDGLADAVLTHDRPIHVPCEDSVVSIDDDGDEVPLRRSRGHAPLPVTVGAGDGDDPAVILATGGDIKTTFALTGRRGRAHLSSHLGDMADPRTQDCFAATVDHLGFLTGSAPTVLAHDLHPQYATTRWAQRRGDRLLAVQHHHAHAVSLLAEHHRLGEPIIAVTYDGTGFGTDGTIWGGELLAVRDPARFTRVGHLAPFALPGGEGAVRQPARIALDLLGRSGIEASDDLPPTIGLTGGVFADRRLLAGITHGLRARGLEVLTHRVVPCNDGGLALGQAAVAAATLSQRMFRERSGPCASESPAR